MGRHREILDAEMEAIDEASMYCVDCDELAIEDESRCLHCKMYAEDVANGMFDRDEDW